MADKSLRAYLRQVLADHVAAPPMAEWLQRVQTLGPAHFGAPTGPDVIAAARAEDDGLIGR